MRVTLYIASSLDGRIADADGGIGFLEAAGTEDHGFDAFFATVDALAMGRATYEASAAFDAWPYARKRCYVLTSTPDAFADDRCVFLPTAEAVLARAAEEGVAHLAYWGGGQSVNALRRVHDVDRFVWGVVPVVLGAGPLLWPTGAPPATFAPEAVERFGPLVLLTYARR